MENIENTETLTGTIDVIGLDVLMVHGKIDTLEEAEALITEATRESVDMVVVGEDTYIIRTTISDLNRVTSVIPEDLDARSAIQVQVKIAEILQRAGINVGITPDLPEEESECCADETECCPAEIAEIAETSSESINCQD